MAMKNARWCLRSCCGSFPTTVWLHKLSSPTSINKHHKHSPKLRRDVSPTRYEGNAADRSYSFSVPLLRNTLCAARERAQLEQPHRLLVHFTFICELAATKLKVTTVLSSLPCKLQRKTCLLAQTRTVQHRPVELKNAPIGHPRTNLMALLTTLSVSSTLDNPSFCCTSCGPAWQDRLHTCQLKGCML